MLHPAISKDRVAVITGGASGIGLATAKRLAAQGMRICLADVDEAQLEAACNSLPTDAIGIKTDVSVLAEVTRLKDAVMDRFGEVSIVMNNAGISRSGASAWQGLEQWESIIQTNFWGMVYGTQTFVPWLIEQKLPAAIIFTGSKQGITNPPGNTAYNVAKAGVRTLAESVAHELRGIADCEVTAHLLVPGWTYTGMTKKYFPEKPDAAWHPEQVADELLTRMSLGDFYIICPDNDVTTEIDNKRVQWNTDDIIKNRPALSRWHQEYQAEFDQYMDKNTD